MQKIVLLLSVVISLFGCTSQRLIDLSETEVELGQGVVFDLLQPASLGRELNVTQIAAIESSHGNHELIFVLQVQSNEMTVVGLLPSGTRVFSLVYDGKLIKSEGYSQLIEKLDPKYLIADIQLSLWSVALLKQHWLTKQSCFKTKKCDLLEHTEQNDKRRELVYGQDTLLEISYKQSDSNAEIIRLVNPKRGYQIQLEATE